MLWKGLLERFVKLRNSSWKKEGNFNSFFLLGEFWGDNDDDDKNNGKLLHECGSAS